MVTVPTRRRVLQGGAAALALPALPASAQMDSPLMLWYAKPAAQWTEALPLGNGRLGAMVFGGAGDERQAGGDVDAAGHRVEADEQQGGK